MTTVEVLGVILLEGSRRVRVATLKDDKSLATLQDHYQTSVAVVLCLSDHVRLTVHSCSPVGFGQGQSD